MNEQFGNLPESEQETRELFKETTAYINAGGRGTRLAGLIQEDSTLPHSQDTGVTKALIKIGDEAIIDYQVHQLKSLGFHNIIIGAGDHQILKDHFINKPHTEPNLEVVTTESQDGTGGDLIKAIREGNDVGKYILVQNCDTLIEADIEKILEAHHHKSAAATIVVTERSNVPNANAFYINEVGRVLYTEEAKNQTQSEPEADQVAFRASSTGMVVINSEIIKNYPWQPNDGPISLYADILPQLVTDGSLYAHSIGENYFIDIGTEDNYAKIQRHPIIARILEQRNLSQQ